MGDISNWKNKNRTYAGKGTASIYLPSDEEKKKINLGLGKFDKKTGTYMPIKKVKK